MNADLTPEQRAELLALALPKGADPSKARMTGPRHALAVLHDSAVLAVLDAMGSPNAVPGSGAHDLATIAAERVTRIAIAAEHVRMAREWEAVLVAARDGEVSAWENLSQEGKEVASSTWVGLIRGSSARVRGITKWLKEQRR